MKTKRLKSIEDRLNDRLKEYQLVITEQEMFSQMLMNKDKRELVGIIIGIIIREGFPK